MTTFGRVGVVGAGVMGCGVAQDLVQTGHEVLLIDRSDAAIDGARSDIRKSMRWQRMLDRGARRESVDELLGRIEFSTDDSQLGTVDAVIENVTEKWELKQEVHARIDVLCRPECLVAANTSTISITRIAGIGTRPHRVIGIHFMNPVPMKPVVEVIRGYHTTPGTVERTRLLLASMNKEGIVVEDMPGFVSNRVLMLMINEAIWLVQDGVATVDQVDSIFRSCMSHKMGPLQTADLIGLDTILHSIEALYDSYGDSKFRSCPLLNKMVDAGLLGCKSGRGFYTYDDGRE